VAGFILSYAVVATFFGVFWFQVLLPHTTHNQNLFAEIGLFVPAIFCLVAFFPLLSAQARPWLSFLVTRVGCGLAGFTDAQVAPLFTQAPANCFLPGIWRQNHFPLIVAGSRGLSETETARHLDEQVSPDFRGEIVSGMAQGVDLGGWHWARARGLSVVEAPALWNRYGRAAGPIRNQWMAWYATHLIALWDGESHGTQHMIRTAENDGLDVRVILTEAPAISPIDRRVCA
jgi:hypothetical protein